MSLAPYEVTVHEGGPNGRPVPAVVWVCEEIVNGQKCMGDAFVIIRIEGQTINHFQCVKCDASYCGTFDGTQCSDHRGSVQ